MRNLFLLFIFSTSLFLFSCDNNEVFPEENPTDDNVENEGGSDESSINAEILNLVNLHRSSIGKPPLEANEVLFEEAKKHTEYMISIDDINHDGFDERADRIREAVNGSSVAENVAYGYPTAEDVVNGWLNSPGHRKNIEGDYTLSGISALRNKNGVYFYTHIFLKQ
ncbi:CAP domain-containing protein [Xanthovirga aplysinae]|uniref:CAP domain-containing protein n=1 Tax=Xanthovirga aplysinae TaxID=2529853 RepID=UPI0012BB4F80|nr:CAP domain-containing protein [Xanthovirga aplysinae]MTI30302.1 CAP domain-containing protein [Xanthovirga aplysinae]